MSRYRSIGVLLLACTLALGALSNLASGATTPPDRSHAAYLAPKTVSPDCGRGTRLLAACDVVEQFFRSVNSRQFVTACELLGTELRSVTYGMTCEHFLQVGSPEPMPYGLLGARVVGSRVVVDVSLGQRELDHIRIRRHHAVIGPELGVLRILATKLVA